MLLKTEVLVVSSSSLSITVEKVRLVVIVFIMDGIDSFSTEDGTDDGTDDTDDTDDDATDDNTDTDGTDDDDATDDDTDTDAADDDTDEIKSSFISAKEA
jgi:hypothetical protein